MFRGNSGNEGAAALASELRSRLRNDDVFYLTKIIPNLVYILGDNCFGLEEGNDCVNAQQRLQFLMCQFVEVMTISSSVSIAVHLDDLHNADDASIGVINQLVFTSKSTQRIFFLASSREGAIMRKMLANLDHFQVPHMHIKMDDLDELAINKTISGTAAPTSTPRSSSVIHRPSQNSRERFILLSLDDVALQRRSITTELKSSPLGVG